MMKTNIYKAYTRVINNETLFFVKIYREFPELRNVPPMLESLGMHRNFLKACNLAGVEDWSAIKDLMEQVDLEMVSGKIVSVDHQQLRKNRERSVSLWYPQYWLSKLRWAHA